MGTESPDDVTATLTQVRFATRDGERRAYFCGHGHDDVTDPPSICDIEIVRGQLVVTETGEVCPAVRQ